MESHKTFLQDAGSTSSGRAVLTAPYHQFKVKDIVANYDRLKAAIAKSHVPTAEHSIRVRIHATSLGFACRLSGGELTTLSIAAEIHDIGKLQIPASILEKPAALSESEWLTVRKHPIWGARLAELAFPSMPEVARCVLLHHERLDGSGYPNGLYGSEIPTFVRIIAVADAFAALTEDRAFRPAFSEAEAVRILMDGESGAYDEDILNLLARARLSH